MSDNHNKQKELINKTRLIVYVSIAAFLTALGVFVNLYSTHVYIYTSFVTKIWVIATLVVNYSVMVLSFLLFIMIIGALGWAVYSTVKELLSKK